MSELDKNTIAKGARNGLLIVFEGLDGAGKSTQVKNLSEYLESKGFPVTVTSWNSSKYISKAVKSAKKAHLLSPKSFSALHAADFFNRLENIIIPSLNAGKIVIADRYFYTALARDESRGIDSEWVTNMYSLSIKPDIAFLCNVPVDTALKRAMKDGKTPSYYESGMDVSGEKNPFESFREFQSKVDCTYNKMASNGSLITIDMDRKREDIFEDIKSHVDTLTEGYNPEQDVFPSQAARLFKPRNRTNNILDSIPSDHSILHEFPKHEYKGKLIVIEGVHRAGVTHQINVLYDWLQIRNFDVVKAGIGETWITSEIMDKAIPRNALSPHTNVMLTVSELAYLMEKIVIPALKRGEIVLLNRYFITSLITGILRRMDSDWLIDTLKGFIVQPDLTVYIDTQFEAILERIDFSGQAARESFFAGLDIGFTRDIETSFDFYQQSALAAYKKIVVNDHIPMVNGISDQKELYPEIAELASKLLKISKSSKHYNKRLAEVLELYHKHNGYFEHAQAVRRFAVTIFDSTRELHKMNDKARELLEYSALLHDIGRSMGSDHEKHSYSFIMNNGFDKFSKQEKRIMSCIALYHNGCARTLDHDRQWKLRPEEQLAVRRLAAILRIADALDASNKQVITKLRVSLEMDSVILDINSVNNAKDERKTVLCKKDLFECQFGINILIDKNRAEQIKARSQKDHVELFK